MIRNIELHIKQESDIKQEPVIKQEPTLVNDSRSPRNDGSREILMDLGMNRKKIIHLNGSNSLSTECMKHLCSDPAFSDLLSYSYPVFQEFTQKFNTWVDVDSENNLRDGAVVKVVFFPKEVETDLLNPGFIKRKRNNSDPEENPKQYSVNGHDSRKKTKSWSRSDEGTKDDMKNVWNEVVYVDTKKTSNKRYSLDTCGSEEKPKNLKVATSPASEKEQCFLLPKVNITNTQVSSPNIQPQKVEERDIHYLSYVVEQTSGAVLTESQILKVKSPNNSLSKGSSKGKNLKQKKKKQKAPASRVQPLSVEKQHLNSPQSSTAPPSSVQPLSVKEHLNSPQISTVNAPPSSVQPLSVKEHLNSPQISTVNVMPARIQPLLVEQKPPSICPEKAAPESKFSKRKISWKTALPPAKRAKRLEWGQKNKKKLWSSTLFSGVAMFGLEGNCIKYFKTREYLQKKCKKCLFWGFRSLHGPNIMSPLISNSASDMAKVLKSKVIDQKNQSNDTIQYLDLFKTQFSSNVIKNTVSGKLYYSMWPRGAEDLSPVYHAWKLVGEKVKNIPCSSKQEMISIVSRVWEKDLDVQLMSSKLISSLPQIIQSVVRRRGSFPLVNVW